LKSTPSVLAREAEPVLSLLCQSRPWVRRMLLATLFGALAALAAQVSLRLPFSPVPITGQVLIALLAGGLLGPKLGALSQIEYLALGASGLPVFAGGSGGPLAFIGPTGGYLFGFVAGAWVAGRLSRGRRGWGWIFCANIAGVLAIYFPGWLWLTAWLMIHQPAAPALAHALVLGVVPFISIDIAKAILATQVVHSLRRSAFACCPGEENELK